MRTALLVLVPALAAASCGNFAYDTASAGLAAGTIETLQRITLKSGDSALYGAQVSVVEADAFAVTISATFDAQNYFGLQASYALLDNGTTLQIIAGKLAKYNFAAATTSRASMAWVAAAAVSTHCSRCSLALLSSILMNPVAAKCSVDLAVDIVITLPASLSYQPVKCAYPTTEICIDIVPATPPPTSQDWSLVGCFADSPTTVFEQSGGSYFVDSPEMSVDACASLALNAANGRTLYVALKAGSQCYSTTNLALATQLGPSTECTTPCAGASNQTCGGDASLSVYEVLTRAPTLSPTGDAPCDCDCACLWTAIDALQFYSPLAQQIALDSALASRYAARDASLAYGFSDALAPLLRAQHETYASLMGDYAFCSCDTNRTLSPATSAPSSYPDASLAPTTSQTYLGCFEISWPDSLPTQRMTTTYAGPLASLAACEQFAADAGETLFGVMHGEYCLAGSSLAFASALPANALRCLWLSSGAEPCAGDASALCGGPGVFALYAVSASTTLAPTVSTPGLAWLGCYKDVNEGNDSRRLLAAELSVTAVASVSECVGNASALNVSLPVLLAVEGTRCYLTHDLAAATALGASSDCVYPCPADAAQTCGAYAGAFSLYELSFTQSPSPPTTLGPTPPTTRTPTQRPTPKPSRTPTRSPVRAPTMRPQSKSPTDRPTSYAPTLRPQEPTAGPSARPTTTTPSKRPSTTGKPTSTSSPVTTAVPSTTKAPTKRPTTSG